MFIFDLLKDNVSTVKLHVYIFQLHISKSSISNSRHIVMLTKCYGWVQGLKIEAYDMHV